ncbi:MAG: integrase domain-containing protein [Pseudodesulfovibrio sp.]|nr:integrase domain-containing protein [Pseudodesulfovibrio sp.]
MGVSKWENVSNKHYQTVADQMRSEGLEYGRIAEVFASARHLCKAYGNDCISNSNASFGVARGSISNQISRAIDPDYINKVIYDLAQNDTYEHAPRAAAQIRLQYELGLRREEAAKVDLNNDWDRESRTLYIQYGPKGGRHRMIEDLSPEQENALTAALPFVSPSNREGINNLMPEGMGDRWQNCLSYAARKHGLTKDQCGFTLHGNRHERFRQVYLNEAGFEPPNKFASIAEFHEAAVQVAGENWHAKDAEARNKIEQLAGHSAGRRDVSSAYLGNSF